MEFLTLSETRARAADIRAAFDNLMENRWLASKRNAAQWKYFQACLEKTLHGSAAALAWAPLQIAQYKFEVEDRLRRLYLRGGPPLKYVFRLFSRRDAWRDNLVVDEDYPDTGGYYLLIRERKEPDGDFATGLAEARARIEMVVAEAAQSEFEAYRALPKLDTAPLLRWFAEEGAAYRDLLHTLTRVSQRGWILTNPQNPSTRRLMAIRVKEIKGDSAVARTTEYWYLRWWSTVEGKYRYPYRETDRQTYILVRRGAHWLVQENIRPAPRSSTSHRQ
ncbi:MAG: hypothetical protein ACKVQQ_24185 [Burkholderiales bacterium]